LKSLLGLLSVLAYLGCIGLYVRSVFGGTTKPHAFSWGIWALTGLITFFAQMVERAGPGAWQQGASALSCTGVMILAFAQGDRTYTRGDWAALVFCLATIPLWVVTGTPLWSILLLCVIDGVGTWPTLNKAWRKPLSEPVLPYALWAAAAGVSIAAIEHYSLVTVVYSAFMVALNGTIAAILFTRRGAAS
jgi:hypothetical protein